MSVGRFAPSPTGRLHLGNLRTALLGWLQARLSNSKFIMRMEDLDLTRVKNGSAKQIIDDLLWLGLDWDEGAKTDASVDHYYQSQRNQYYQQAMNLLDAKGKIYPCYCSRKDIREASSAPHGRHPLIYPGTCRDKHYAAPACNPDSAVGRLASWRFRVGGETISFEDAVAGCVSQNLARQVGDFIVKRTDGLFAYQLAVVVDDINMGVTDVLRGDDLLDSSARQIALYTALECTPPRFWHVKLMDDQRGNRMSKRNGADSLDVLREQGLSADQIIGMLARSCGLHESDCPVSAKELAQKLTLEHFIEKLKLKC